MMSSERQQLALLTDADPIQQAQYQTSSIDLARSLKTAVILWGKVTCPAAAILESHITQQVFQDSHMLLAEGILIPDLRQEYDCFCHYVADKKAILPDYDSALAMARFLDRIPVQIIRFPGYDLSRDFSTNLTDLLFHAHNSGLIRMPWRNMEMIAESFLEENILERSAALSIALQMATPKHSVLAIVQTLYHMLGSQVTGSDLVWPVTYSGLVQQLAQAQITGDSRNLSRDALRIAAKYGILDRTSNYKTVIQKSRRAFDALTVTLDAMLLSPQILDNLSWSDVVHLSRSNVAQRVRRTLIAGDVTQHADFEELKQDIINRVQKESRRLRFVRNTSMSIGISSIASGCICLFSNAVLGSILTVAGVALTCGDYMLNHILPGSYRPLTLLGETIQRTALRNKISERYTSQ